MMREQVIEAVELRYLSTFKVSLDRFCFQGDRPHKWLQRICFSILRKLRCFAFDETVRVERHVIDGDTFMARLLNQSSALSNLLGKNPTRLLIGSEDYGELMDEIPANAVFSFKSRYGKDREILGLTVTVIPWMRGVLVMP